MASKIMISVDDVLVSEAIFENDFVCNLSKCKGGCCVQGDAGAPLKKEEKTLLQQEYPNFRDYLTPKGIDSIEKEGYSVYDPEDKDDKTTLIDGGPCAYINYDEKGIAICGIEKAYFDKKTTFRKPLSCHLYPIRVSAVGSLSAVNYEKWDICDDACTLGKELQIPVYKFLKEPLIRAFGEAFYEAIDEYAKEEKEK